MHEFKIYDNIPDDFKKVALALKIKIEKQDWFKGGELLFAGGEELVKEDKIIVSARGASERLQNYDIMEVIRRSELNNPKIVDKTLTNLRNVLKKSGKS